MKTTRKFRLQLAGFCAVFVILFGVAAGFTCSGGWGAACAPPPDTGRYFIPSDQTAGVSPGWEVKLRMLGSR